MMKKCGKSKGEFDWLCVYVGLLFGFLCLLIGCFSWAALYFLAALVFSFTMRKDAAVKAEHDDMASRMDAIRGLNDRQIKGRDSELYDMKNKQSRTEANLRIMTRSTYKWVDLSDKLATRVRRLRMGIKGLAERHDHELDGTQESLRHYKFVAKQKARIVKMQQKTIGNLKEENVALQSYNARLTNAWLGKEPNDGV